MKGFIKKIKEKRIAKKSIGDKMIYVSKNKELSDNEKFVKILDMLGAYYMREHFNRVNMDVFEMYYEMFMKNGKKDIEKYKYCFKDSNNNYNYVNGVALFKSFTNLKNIDVDALNTTEKDICEKLDKLNRIFNSKFDFTLFYKNEEVNKYITNKLESILNLVIKNYKKKNNIFDDLFSVNNVNDYVQNFER